MNSNEYEYLAITAYLRTPVIADRWLPLDGILLYQMVRMDLSARVLTIPGASLLRQPKGADMKGGKLPIKIVHRADWYYRCSWAEWGPYVDGKDYWNKRFDQSMAILIDFGKRIGVVNNLAGPYKAYHMPIFYRSALWVRWYCVGDKQQIAKLLEGCTHIGKKINQGWGRVARWEVETIPEDWSIWKEGKLMRGIPPEGNINGEVGIYGIRPPYWDSRNHVVLVLPHGDG